MMKIGIKHHAYIGQYGMAEGIKRLKRHGYEAFAKAVRGTAYAGADNTAFHITYKYFSMRRKG